MIAVNMGLEYVNNQQHAQEKAKDVAENNGYEKPVPVGVTTEATQSSMEAAEAAFAKGITIEDPQNDWYNFPNNSIEGDGRPNNPNPYSLPWTDLREFSLGADSKYLYVRYRFWGTAPTDSVVFGDDRITSVVFKMEYSYTKPDGSSDVGFTDDGYMWIGENGKPTDKPRLMHSAWFGKTAIADQRGEETYSNTNVDGFIGGGPGYDYIIASYSLEGLGFSPGSEIRFQCGTETGSEKYHHECVDNLLGSPTDKDAPQIIYIIGTPTYKTKSEEKVTDPHKIPVSGTTKPFTTDTLAKAEDALASGVTIEDGESDWFKVPPGTMQPDGRLDNSNPYPLPFTDLRSFSIGADDEWLYVKYGLWGDVPGSMPTYNDDQIWGFSYRLSLEYNNTEGKPDDATAMDGYSWYTTQAGLLDVPLRTHSADLTTNGADKLGEIIYTSTNIDGSIGGGAGCDYIIASYSLEALHIKPGIVIVFRCDTETNSAMYHHECMDGLLGPPEEKGGATISYRLGEKTYKVIDKNTNRPNSTPITSAKPFDSETLAKAEAALAAGFTVDDPQGDWFQFPADSIQPDGRPDNSNPYPLPWTDLKSVSIGTDDEYLYIRYRYWGSIPEGMTTYAGDRIHGIAYKLDITYSNLEGRNDSGLTQDGYWWIGNDNTIYAPPQVAHSALLTPSGQDEHLETRYSNTIMDGYFGGGTGADYILAAYPLKQLGLSKGSVLNISCSTETGSDTYHHECLDLLLGSQNSKFPTLIHWVIGESTYTTSEQK